MQVPVNIDRFDGRPGVLMLCMGCAELGVSSTSVSEAYDLNVTHRLTDDM